LITVITFQVFKFNREKCLKNRKGDALIDVVGVLLPADLNKEDFSILTERRQKILILLLKEPSIVSRLVEKNPELAQSSVSEALEIFTSKDIVKKDDNKVYSLTTKGKLLTLSLLKPNGESEAQIREELDKVLKEDFKIEEQDIRQEIVENCRDVNRTI